MFTKYSYIILFLLLLLSSCKKETETISVDLNLNYFPTDTGTYIVYKGDSIIYNYFFNQVRRNHSFFVKELIKDNFIDNLGRQAQRIERYITDDTLNWGTPHVWYQVRDNKTAERVEDNLRYLKLVFPFDASTTWKPNKFITTYIPYIALIDSSINANLSTAIITSTATNYTNAFNTYTNVVTTENMIDSSAVNYFKLSEKYAKNIGLVYREQWNVIAKDPAANLTLPWIDRARVGFYVRLEAIRYGKE